MGLKRRLKNNPVLYSFLFSILNSVNYFNFRFRLLYPRYIVTDRWAKRIQRVKECPDNEKIKCVSDAGVIFKGYQLMHNGLKIGLGSYYDYGNTRLIAENRGIHEPEEEYFFQEVLKEMPENASMM